MPIDNFPKALHEKWQALPQKWRALPKKWQGLPLLLRSTQILYTYAHDFWKLGTIDLTVEAQALTLPLV